MMEFRHFLRCLCFTTLVTFTASRTLCPRIFFQNIDESETPFKLVEGVFVKQSSTHNGFPVYLRENDNVFFYYNKQNGGNSLMFGISKLGNYFAMAGIVQNYVSPSVWLSSGSLDRNDVFGGLISRWVYKSDRDGINYTVWTPPTIKAVCVEKDFRECLSDRIYMNMMFTGGGKVINNATTDYFSRIPGLFRNLRPVYKHNTQSWYLQFTSDQYWLVTSANVPTTHTAGSMYMRVNDLALRPEYITKTWSVHYVDGWKDEYSLQVRCRGISSGTNKCSTLPCRSGSTCVYTSDNETLCVCASGYTGLRCDVNKQCSTPNPIYGKEIGFNYPGRLPGALAITFCRGRYPYTRFAICEDETYGSYWVRQGRACTSRIFSSTPYPTYMPKVTTRDITRWHPTEAKQINFDDIPGLMPAVIVIAILLQILLPYIIKLCAYCRKSCKETDEETEDARRAQQFNEQLERRLENVTRAESQEELDQGLQNYREEVERYQRETEETETKRKKGIYRNTSLWRLTSMHMYFSFYLWMIYLIFYEYTSYKGVVLFVLYIIGIIVMIVAPIIVFIESAFSHELDYIKNIMEDETAWSYIERMQQVAPILNFKVECYHWETRTRVVYDTDANGNSQSRIETYQERVVTYVDYDRFSYGSWVDVSKKEMPTLSTVALTRLKIDLYILFGDNETANDFIQQKTDMLERNRHRDELMDFSCDEEVPGLAKRISAYVDLRLKPWWIRPGYFWLATLLFMSWPYRWIFRARTAKNYYDLKKKIYKTTTPPREVDPMDPVAVLQQRQLQDHVNPSFAMSEIPPQPQQVQPPYPGMAPVGSQAPPYPPPTAGSTAAPPYPATAPGSTAAPPYPATAPGSTAAPPYPGAAPAGNQPPPYAPTAPYPPMSQGMEQVSVPPTVMEAVPSAPPPSYDAAVNQNPPHA